MKQAIIFCLLVATSASAQVARVFLAGTGNDAGDCTNQATPCRSLQGAVTACPVNGEIIILDNGGYGGATITKSLTVNASAGIVAFIARTITVNIGATDKVVLRGLSMNGVVFGDPNGILFSGGGTLVVENSVIAGFTTAVGTSIGINQTAAGSNLIVNNCELRNNDSGLVNGTGSTTNSNTGWRLIQDVEREALKSYLGAIYTLNQAIAHRGLLETLPSVQPLAAPADPAPYFGSYVRPNNSYVVRAEGGKLFVEDRPNGGTPRASPVAFYGPDRVVVTDGPDRGQSIEFVRDDSGRVHWIRVVGRVAARDAAAAR